MLPLQWGMYQQKMPSEDLRHRLLRSSSCSPQNGRLSLAPALEAGSL